MFPESLCQGVCGVCPEGFPLKATEAITLVWFANSPTAFFQRRFNFLEHKGYKK